MNTELDQSGRKWILSVYHPYHRKWIIQEESDGTTLPDLLAKFFKWQSSGQSVQLEYCLPHESI